MSRSSRLTAHIRILTAALGVLGLAVILSCGESPTGVAGSTTSIRPDGLVEIIFHYPDSVKYPSADASANVQASAPSSVSANVLAAPLGFANSAAPAVPPTYVVTPVAFAPEAAPAATAGKGPNCDDCLLPNVPLGFTFRFYGTDYSSINIGSNGIVGFGVNNMRDGCCWGAYIARNDVNNNIIALGWADWMPNAVANGIRYETRGSAPNRRFVLQFNNVPESGGGGRITAQLVLYEHTNEIALYTTTLSTTVRRNTLTQGLENLPASEAFYLAGRDSAHFVLANDGVKFSPAASNEQPIITAAPNLSVNTGAGVCAANVDPGAPTITDDAPGSTYVGVRSDGLALDAAYPKGVTTITWTATDVEGLHATTTQTVSVSDKENPSISAPDNVSVRTNQGVSFASVAIGNATAADNCPNVTVAATRSDNAPTIAGYPQGVTTITWVATDADGNKASASQTITISANQPPVISAPANISFSTDPGACVATVNVGTATASDDLPGTTVSGTRSDGLALNAAYPKGVTSITWTATDVEGLTASAVQSVTVSDNESPSVVASPNLDVNTDPGSAMATVHVASAVASDNCPNVSVSGPSGDMSLPVGSTVLHWNAVDEAGNSSSASQVISVHDVEAPIVGVPANLTVNATMPSGAMVSFSTNYSDNVGVSSFSCDRNSGTVFPMGASTVSCTARDAAGNSQSVSFTVTVLDAPQQIVSLIEFIRGMPIPEPQRTQLTDALGNALSNPRNVAIACPAFTGFISLVQNNTPKYIPADKSAQVIVDATRIKAVIGCP